MWKEPLGGVVYSKGWSAQQKKTMPEEEHWQSKTHLRRTTYLTKVEMVINSRPSYVSSDNLQEPLTPAHFLTGRKVLSLPDRLCCGDNIHDEEVDLTRGHLTKRINYMNVVLNHIWKRWQQEYLLELRESLRSVVVPLQSMPMTLCSFRKRTLEPFGN